MLGGDAPGGQFRLAWQTDVDAELASGIGESAALLLTRRNLSGKDIGGRLRSVHEQYRHDDRPLGIPRRLAQLRQDAVDLCRVEPHSQSVRPVIASLIVLFRDAGHHIEVIEGGDEAVGMRGYFDYLDM